MEDTPVPLSPGIYDNIPADVYHKIPAIGSTTLKRLHISSPKHVHDKKIEPSAAMELGTAFHAFLLDRDFHQRFYAMPEKKLNWTTVEGRVEKAEHLKIEALNAGRHCLSADDMKCIECAYQEFRDHPFGSTLAGDIASKKARTEVTLIWDEWSGYEGDGPKFLCKARLDILNGNKIIDPKTTRNANPLKFQWDILPTKEGFNYWIQAGWYWRGAKANGLDIDAFEFAAVEMDPPHGITWHCFDEAELSSMQQRVGHLARTWAVCQQTNVYPNYSPIKHMLSIGGDE